MDSRELRDREVTLQQVEGCAGALSTYYVGMIYVSSPYRKPTHSPSDPKKIALVMVQQGQHDLIVSRKPLNYFRHHSACPLITLGRLKAVSDGR